MTDTTDTASETTPVHGCGLPMSRNPHPDAGKPTMAGAAVGYSWECIPCLVKTRNRVGHNWRSAQERIRSLAVALQTHRADMHSTSGRPCSTCQTSARVRHMTVFAEGHQEATALSDEVVHQCPPDGSGLMPCCDLTPFEVPRWHRMTLDVSAVTCNRGNGAIGPDGASG